LAIFRRLQNRQIENPANFSRYMVHTQSMRQRCSSVRNCHVFCP